MPHRPPSKTGVLLLNMGGPDDQDSVKPFLYNLFSDPDIIRLPLSFIFQKPLAWWIVTNRGDEAKENYQKMGGGSPQLPITREQAASLEASLYDAGMKFPVYIAMRYWHPFTDEALAQIQTDGIENLIVVTLYPHFSYTTTGSSLNELRRVMKSMGMEHTVRLSVVGAYYKNPDYQAALAGCIRDGLADGNWSCDEDNVRILFSAHSLPLRHIKRTQDPYPTHTYDCINMVMTRYFPNHTWDLAYQSKVGKMPWLGPSTDGVLQYYAGLELDNILVVPVSFVSDHVETLVEIDLDYLSLARDVGIQHIHRAPVMNTRPDFIQTLVTQIQDKAMRRFPESVPHLTLHEEAG